MTTLISEYGKHDQKGTVLGIFRSLGALARSLGPIFASIGMTFFEKELKIFFFEEIKNKILFIF